MILKKGSRGDNVRWLQSVLWHLGYYDGDITGYFDYILEVCVSDFQREHKLTIDGKVGNFTKTALGEALSKIEVIYPFSDSFKYSDAILYSDGWAKADGIPIEYLANLQQLFDALESVQDKLNITLGYTCIYRSPQYEKYHRISSTYRTHLKACAIDCYDKSGKYTTYELAKAIYEDDNLRLLFGGLGLGSDSIVHLDVYRRNKRLEPTIWWYTHKSWKEWNNYNKN